MVDHWRRSQGSCLWAMRICATDDIVGCLKITKDNQKAEAKLQTQG